MEEMPEATTAPDALCCPISMEIMRDPVIAAEGHTYERADIESWFANNRTSPKTGAVLPHCSLIPNHAVKAMISDFHDEARRRQAVLDEDEDDDEALPAAHEEEGDADEAMEERDAGAAANNDEEDEEEDEEDDDDEDEEYEDDGANADDDDEEDNEDDEDENDASPRAPVRRGGPAAVAEEGDGGARTKTSSRFWGVHWDRRKKKWQANYYDANGKTRQIGRFDDEEEAARAVNKAIRDAGLEGRRRTNAVDATGALVPKTPGASCKTGRDRSAVVAPDPSRAPSATTSKYWGVTWHKRDRRWQAEYKDANRKTRYIGLFDTQEAAAHAVNAAIRRAGLEGKRRTNAVVDGQLVPKKRKANGLGWRSQKRRREEPDDDSDY